jgi:hypothetical protein
MEISYEKRIKNVKTGYALRAKSDDIHAVFCTYGDSDLCPIRTKIHNFVVDHEDMSLEQIKNYISANRAEFGLGAL